jgi:toxin ParE1/3/4
MLPVNWLPSALDDLGQITEYIAEKSPQPARRLNAKIQGDAQSLGQDMVHFRRGRVPGTHEFVSHPNYVIVYRRTLLAVEILNVLHTRQAYPK